jgi:hypothetical protein
MGGRGQEPQCNTVFAHSTKPVKTITSIDVFANESYKTKSSEDIVYDKITMLKARVKAIEGVDF